MAKRNKQKSIDHQARWNHNRDFISTIDDVHADWMLTVAFYAALHAIETLFAHDGQANGHTHLIRNKILRETNRYSQIWRMYRPLYDGSITSRYIVEPLDWVSERDVKDKMIGNYLYGVEKSVQKLIGAKTLLAPIKFQTP